ncbi:peptidase S45 [Reticulibacter mediterranei]|uniref:Peptidase S45 n=1 Tax=Reticulibacter mediterranei TaxID=2778369 RepID=A0A8J3IJG9_9CHLR|nr:penicillin acylase family protein [Reticulibacter mediterranei]GHO95651.1 peptidase S45 [Reticulibacter mediterranei]
MASWWQKTLLSAANLAGFAAGSYSLLTRRPVSQKNGTLHIRGLHEPVEIITDSYGVPHIYAQNEDDLFFAQGYLHAQDRLWQMDFNRRLGAGRLSELFGPIALETDRFCRRLGLHRSAAAELPRLSEHNLRMLNAYSSGVNTFIEQNANKLSVEFTLLAYKPEPWQPADSIQWAKMMGWNLSGNWETEIIRARLVAKLGPERAARLEAGYDPSHPLIIPPGVEYGGINSGLLEQYAQIQELSGFSSLGGSNNWVVDGTKTETGAPILCNDPHLGQAVPSIWYECHLVAGDIDVVGASFPGAPCVVIGHNHYITWGVTNAVSDVEDLYVEKFNPNNPHQYEYQGQWEEAQIVKEEIRVKGQNEAVVEEVRITRHGPILTHMPALNSQEQSLELPLALRWTGLEQCRIISATQKLNRATNWQEFLTALHDWDVPPQNFVYADRDGNIGYVMAGAIPTRTQGQTLLPSPGWTGEHEWTGLIPFEELPQSFNPEQHFIVTANNRVVDDNYPYYISNEWLNGYRAQRIRDLLNSKEKLTVDDMAKIQADQYALPALEIVPYILELEATTPTERAAQEILTTWDYVLSPDSIAAALYTTFLRKLERIVLDPLLGDEENLLHGYLGVGSTLLATQNGYASRSKPWLIRLLKEQDDSWFANSLILNGPKTWKEALSSALQATIEELQDRRGENILRWQYGAIHHMTYNHPLGAVKPLDAVFNRGPHMVGGDIDTVNMGASLPNRPEVVITVPSYRQIVDLADLTASRSGHAPGQSGHVASKHYDDFIAMWREVQHHPMLFTREMIEANTEGTLRLLPK